MDLNSLTEQQRKEEIKTVNKKAALSLAPVILAYIVFVLIRTSGGTIWYYVKSWYKLKRNFLISFN